MRSSGKRLLEAVPMPDLDMMFRLQHGVGGEDRRFVRNEEPSARRYLTRHDAKAPPVRRQRAALQASASSGGGAGSVGLKAFAYFLESELVTPLAQIVDRASTLAGAAAGWFTWTTAILGRPAVSFGTRWSAPPPALQRGPPWFPGREELRGCSWLRRWKYSCTARFTPGRGSPACSTQASAAW